MLIITVMQVTVIYIYPMAGEGRYGQLALNFLESYRSNPPGYKHDTVVVANGAPITEDMRHMFGGLPGLILFEHDNSGYDIGAWQHVCREIPSEMVVFLGASTYFKGANWLKRMVEAVEAHGDAQYGTMGNLGNLQGVAPHIRTTAFWMFQSLFNSYPIAIIKAEQRYEFEHGRSCFTSWVQSIGLKSWVINWRSDLVWPHWNDSPNGFHRGNQMDLMVGDRLTMPPYYPHP